MASIDKRPNGKWRARYYDPSGRQRASHHDRKTDAQRWLDEQTAGMVTGQYVGPNAGKITFREYAEAWRDAQVHRPGSATKVESVLRLHAYPAFGDRQIGSILPSHIQAWVKGLPLAASTVAVAHGIVAGVFNAAVADRRIASSPCEGTRLPESVPEEIVPLSVEEVAALTDALPGHLQGLVTLAASTGLRQGEVFGLTVDRSGLRPLSKRPTLKVDRQLVTVPHEGQHLGPPKTKASRRTVPLPEVAVTGLATHMAAFPPTVQSIEVRDGGRKPTHEDVELVFTRPKGAPLSRSHFSRYWRKAVEKTSLPESTTFHDLRHFYASLLIRHGESVKVVQSRLGHATAAETMDTYSHLWPDSADTTRSAIDSVLGAPKDSLRTEESS